MALHNGVRVQALDLGKVEQAAAFIELLDHYALDPMGGSTGLSAYTREHLVAALASQPGFLGGLAMAGTQAVGLINCFSGFSTFAARPLLNIHDIVVHADWRGKGVGQALLAFAEAQAQALGCCKLTLEVLSGNAVALRAYERAGFAPYVLDPQAGQALFLQKKLG